MSYVTHNDAARPSREMVGWTVPHASSFSRRRKKDAIEPEVTIYELFTDWRRGWDSNPRAAFATNRFRGDPVTTTSVPLRTDVYPRNARSNLHPILEASALRRAAKNPCSSAALSAASTPDTTRNRWFSAGCSWARCDDSIAPAFGSGAP